MSDYEENDEDVIENKGNESVDWSDDVDEGQHFPMSSNSFMANFDGPGRRVLSTVPEEPSHFRESQEENISPVRRVQVNQESVYITPRNGSNTFGEGLGGSFFSQKQNFIDSGEFCGDAAKNFELMEAEQKALESSGRRLNLPQDFDPKNYNFTQESSWDKGPHQWNLQTESEKIARSPLKKQELQAPVYQPELVKMELLSPQKSAELDNQTTPIRQKNMLSRLSSHTTLQSTPKREGSEPPIFQVSAIGNPGENFFNSQLLFSETTSNETSNIPVSKVVEGVNSIPADTKSEDIFEILEKIRKEKLAKQSAREKERQNFINNRSVKEFQIVRRPLESTENFDEQKQNISTKRIEEKKSNRSMDRNEEKKANKSTSFESKAKSFSFKQNSPRNSREIPIKEEFMPQSRGQQSETISRASSSASISRPGTQMSSVSSKGEKCLKIHGASGKFLVFGCVALKNSAVKELKLTNLSESIISIEANLSKEIGYKILDGNCMQLAPNEMTTLRIQFAPSDEYRYNSALKIKTNVFAEYTISLRGFGGKAKIRLEKSHNIERSSTGPYLMSNQFMHGTHQLRVINDGIHAYCKVLVLYGGQAIEAAVEPSPCMVLKRNQGVDIKITISERAMEKSRREQRRESMQSIRSISSQCSAYEGLEVVLLWGEEVYRQRAFEFLKQTKGEFVNSPFSLKDTFKDQKKFEVKRDYQLQQTDLSIFEGSVQHYSIRIIPSALHQNQQIFDETLRPDDTVARLQRDWDEKTLVNDYNETTIRN